ncbi:MAG: hypothetical protein OXC63_01675 [Aestuariivita sp.]|nr:hypothetical protein [Aestuariivita sp.]MCY4348131.1 hypothetical protein [Aestuariivita sp.]
MNQTRVVLPHCGSMAMTAGVFRQSHIIEHDARFLHQQNEFDHEIDISIRHSFAQNEDRKPSQTTHILGSVPGANAAFVFIPLE